MTWPTTWKPVPDEDWAKQPLEELAMKYDTVEEHGWYDNLDPTVEQLAATYDVNSLILDYSGGTGILTDRLIRRCQQESPQVLIVDSSPKFLRLALEKLQHRSNVSYRLIRYLKKERRLQSLDEVVEPLLYERGVDAVVSTNAMHLYYNLPETVQSWRAILKEGGRLIAQSGNIRNPSAPKDAWIIDETVEHIHRAVLDIVQEQEPYSELRPFIANQEYMAAHDRLRKKYFLPVRELSHYLSCIEQSGFSVERVEHRPISAKVQQWYSFLEVYHEGVLGWVGGATKITKKEASSASIALRKQLMWEGMQRIFGGSEHFDAVWTYITAVKSP